MPKKKPASPWDVACGRRLRVARLGAKKTQMQAAAALGCSFQMYQKLEKGSARLHAEDAVNLAKMFRVSVLLLISI